MSVAPWSGTGGFKQLLSGPKSSLQELSLLPVPKSPGRAALGEEESDAALGRGREKGKLERKFLQESRLAWTVADKKGRREVPNVPALWDS